MAIPSDLMIRRRLQSTLPPLLAWICASAFIFRRSILSGFNILPGDELDSRLILRIQEHWYRFFSGRADWLDLGMFYPTQNSLGFSDTFFLYGITHSIFRSMGLDLFHAGIANLFLLSAIGFFGMYLVCRRALTFTRPASLFLSILFLCLSPVNMATIYMHTQIYSVWYIPWVVLLGHGFYQSLDKPFWQNAKWASGTGLAFALALYNAVYIPWFLAIFLVVTVLIGLILYLCKPLQESVIHDSSTRISRIKDKLGALGATLFKQSGKWILLGFSFGLSLVPFFLTYLPILKVSHGHDFSSAMRSLPYLRDLFNTSHWSLVWGWLAPAPELPNHAFGLPLVSFVLSLGSIAYGLFFYRSKRAGLRSEPFVKSISAGILACWLLMLRFGDQSLWIIPFELVPGASAIRVVYRFNVLLCIPILILWGLMIDGTLLKLGSAAAKGAKNKAAYSALAILACFVLVEQSLKPTGPDTHEWNLKRSRIANRLAEIPPPPADAKVFFVTPYKEPGNRYDLRSQLEAWAIAQDYDLKTLNGYSGILPKYFRLFGVPGSKYPHEYDFVIRSWISLNNIQEPIHQLDLNTKIWSRYDPSEREQDIPIYPLGTPLVFKRGNPEQNPYELSRSLTYGWSGPEPSHTWSDGDKAELIVRLSEPAETDLKLRVHCFAFVNKKHPRQRIHFSINGERIGTAEPKGFSAADWHEFTIPKALVENTTFLRIRLDCPDAKAPADVYDSSDHRKLGIGMIEMVVESQ